jgi:putative CocE/NonD family hydrolase
MSVTDVHIQHDLKIPMRDGVLLSGDLYTPVDGQTSWPVLLCRTIYDNQQDRYVGWSMRFARNGYAVLIQDCRGRYDSEGTWTPYECEAEDGYDTQEWIGRQPWFRDGIGTFGISYVGFTQILPSKFDSKYVKALVPCANQEDNFGHFYIDGVLQLQNAVNLGWIGRRTNRSTSWPLVDRHALYRKLPINSALEGVTEMPTFDLFLSKPTFDDYWKSYSMKYVYEQCDQPALFLTGWYDNLVHEQFKCFKGWSERAKTEQTRKLSKLMVGPWGHNPMGTITCWNDVNFTAAGEGDVVGIHLKWFDQRLKGIDNGTDTDAPLQLFVMGDNEWRGEWEWPLARTEWTNYYLHSGGVANTRFGDGTLSTDAPGEEKVDTFVYDPLNPVPTVGGQSMFIENCGPIDRASVERRDDVLVYTTPTLTEDVEVTGPVKLVLYAETDALDTDFTATLCDVHPRGKSINICEGIIRARYRESMEHTTLIEPNTVYEYTVDLWETSNVFKAGHQIRLEISSSNFPRFARNLNTGADVSADAEVKTANQTIYHDTVRPSHLVLPVIPR